MTIEKLKRGQQIQDDICLLKTQLKAFVDEKHTVLKELTHPCSRRFESTELQELNDLVANFAISSMNTKLRQLEKEFQKL